MVVLICIPSAANAALPLICKLKEIALLTASNQNTRTDKSISCYLHWLSVLQNNEQLADHCGNCNWELDIETSLPTC